MKYLFLFLIIIFAQSVETTIGFGSTIIALGLGAYLFSIKEIIIALVMIGWLQSLFLIVRGWKHILWKILLTRILLFSAIGMPVGMLLYSYFDERQLKLALGIFIVLISAHQIYTLLKNNGELKPLHFVPATIVLILGGFIHGIFATGGPLIVYFASREIKEKAAFRATISMLWIILNTALLIKYFIAGQLVKQPLQLAGMLVPALLIGIGIGELIHPRVNERIFKFVVQGILLLTGLSLLFNL